MLFSSEHVGIGLDISDQMLRAVELKRSLQGALSLRAYSSCHIDPEICVEGVIKKPNELTAAIRKMLDKPASGSFSSSYTIASLPETKTFIKLIDIPPMPQDEAAAAVKWEAEHHIPIPFEEAYWDFQIMPENTEHNARLPVLLGLVPKDIAESYNAAITEARLIPIGFEIEAVAISRSLLNWKTPPAQATIIIDFGATRTGLIVVDKGIIQFTVSLPTSGQSLTKTIADKLNLSLAEAEQAKVVCGLNPERGEGAVAKILKPDIDELANKVRDAIAFFQEHFPKGSPVEHVILCGGGANLDKLDERLAQSLELGVVKGNPATNLDRYPSTLSAPELPSYATAIGLALRSFIPNREL